MRDFEEAFEEIFETAAGFREPAEDTCWVPVVMQDGTAYADAYEVFSNARENLRRRLDVDLDDPDLYNLLGGVMGIEREIARVMFYCGAEYAYKNRKA